MALPIHVAPNNQMWERWFYTENPTWLTFQCSSDYLATLTQDRAICTLGYLNEFVLAGETITFEWDGNILVFEFATLPLDDSGNQITENSTGVVPYSLYYIYIVAALSTNYTFNNNFTVGVTGAGFIELKLKKPNTNITVTVTSPQMYANVTNPATPLPNYTMAFLLEVSDNTGASLGNLSIHQKPNQYGFVRFDIGTIIRNYVPWITPIEIMNAGITRNKRNLRIAYTEQYGEPPVPKKLQYTQELLFIKGGVLWQEEVANYDPSPMGDLWLSKHFLTKQPQYKTITIRQPEWLFWLHHDLSFWATVMVECHFADGSTVISTDYWVWIEEGEITSIPTSWEYLNGLLYLDGGSGTPPIYCRLVLYSTDTNEEISQPQYYNYSDCYFADRYILVANRWGGADTIAVSAPAEITIKTTEKGIAVLNQDYHVESINGGIPISPTNDFEGQEQVFLKKTKEIIKTDTAYLYPKDHLPWLKDTIRMSQIWEISDHPLYGKQLLPIDILAESIKIENEADDLVNISFDYTNRI